MTTILIIEDEPAILNLIKSTLTAEGYACRCAFDGQQGVELLDGGHYDLVLLDLMLPEIGGYELLEYIGN
ncbi:MAG: response regulator [Oscillospiraceae bacterium]|nr:response regulator [Oscillospiraceae bacterium]